MYEKIDALRNISGCTVLVDEPMSAHTSFRIGGPADRFVCVENQEALKKVLETIADEQLPLFVLGKGSNLLVADEGFRGVVLSLEGDFKQITLDNDGVTIRCGAGASLSSLCKFARDHALSGLEFAWGIPGSAGGAAYMNAGAYGGEMKDVLTSVQAVSLDGREKTLYADELDLSYRHSVFTGGTDMITFVCLRLVPSKVEQIQSRMNELILRRKEKQPLEFASAGSTFKRPEGYFAAALIEQCGLKGYTIGGAQVSFKHSGFIINTGNATCKEVLALIAHVQYVVEEQAHVRLQTEVEFLGL